MFINVSLARSPFFRDIRLGTSLRLLFGGASRGIVPGANCSGTGGVGTVVEAAFEDTLDGCIVCGADRLRQRLIRNDKVTERAGRLAVGGAWRGSGVARQDVEVGHWTVPVQRGLLRRRGRGNGLPRPEERITV